MSVISTATLDISLFGSFQLHHSIHGEIKENRRKVQALLIWLLLEDDQAHSREQLIALLWPEMNREDGLRNLRVALSRVKKHLADGESLEANRSEVLLHRSNNHQIDVRQFDQLITETEKHSHESLARCSDCLSKLRKATNLFRGRFLDGFSLGDGELFEEWLFVLRERYHVMGLTQLSRLAHAEMVNGRFDEAEELAQRQIKIDPIQESAHRMLMRLAAERGDRTQALRQFKICSEMLQNELGIPPDEETFALKHKIEAGEIKVRQTPQVQHPERPPQKRNQLPETITPFIGRDEELALLAKRLSARDYRLISLVGPGGIGKTRLAIQAARGARADFKDGTYFVSLVGLSSPEDIPAAVAEVLEINLTSEAKSPADQISAFLANKEVLLVIDNLEHVIQGADYLLDWIEHAPKLMLIVTSRERVNAQVEDLYRLKGLPWPQDVYDLDAAKYESVRLFGDRAHRLNKRFWLNEDTLPDVVRICQQVEGLPLALELAATSIRDFDVSEIAETLTQEPELLATDLRDMPSRHRQFETVFDYSWSLLTEKEQQTLAQLSLFAGGFSREAAKSITGASTITLTRLLYKSLIRSDGGGRYSMHELLRQSAARKLNESDGWIKEVAGKHAHFYLNWLQKKSGNLAKAGADLVAQNLWQDIDNIRNGWRSAVDLGLGDLIQSTLPALTTMYAHLGLADEGVSQIDFALSQFQNRPRYFTTEFQILANLKKLSLIYQHRSFEERKQLFDSILDLLEGYPNREAYEAEARCYWSNVLVFNLDAKTALSQSEIALSLLAKIEDPKLKGDVFRQHAIGKYRDRKLDDALALFSISLRHYEEVDDLKGQASVYERLAPAHAEHANYWGSFLNDKKSVEILEKLNDSNSLPKAYLGLARSNYLLGDFDKVRTNVDRFFKICHRQKITNDLIRGQILLAEVAFQEGSFAESRKLFESCAAQFRAEGNALRLSLALIDLSRALWQMNQFKIALPLAEEGVELISHLNDFYETVEAETVLALIKWKMGHKEDALKLIHRFQPEIEPFHLMEPEKTLYEMFIVLNEAGDDAAPVVLNQAHQVLNHIVKNIPDPKIQDSFLKNIIYCRLLSKAFEDNQLPALGGQTKKDPSPIA